MYNHGTRQNPILKKDGFTYRFELQDCTVNGFDFYKVFSFSEELDAWEFVGTYLRSSRETLTQMYDAVRHGHLETNDFEF